MKNIADIVDTKLILLPPTNNLVCCSYSIIK